MTPIRVCAGMMPGMMPGMAGHPIFVGLAA